MSNVTSVCLSVSRRLKSSVHTAGIWIPLGDSVLASRCLAYREHHPESDEEHFYGQCHGYDQYKSKRGFSRMPSRGMNGSV
jgi:hypothetical protein